MWPQPPLRNNVVSIIITPNSIHCGWITAHKKEYLYLAAYEVHQVECTTIPAIRHHITHFVEQYHLQHSFCMVALNAPLMHEEFVRLSKASPSPGDFSHKSLYQLLWDFHYLYGLDDGSHLFYVRGIKKSVLFEYELLAKQTDLILTAVTSQYAAQLNAYAYVYGPAFRQSQRALDLIKYEYKISQSIKKETLSQLLKINPALDQTILEPSIQAAMIGMYY